MTSAGRLHSVVVVDDQQVVVEGLQHMLAGSSGFEIVDTAESGSAAVTIAERVQPALCLLDVRLPDLAGPLLVRAIQEASPGTVCVMFTVYDDPEEIRACLDAGARGYLSKATTTPDLERALDLVLAGKLVIDFAPSALAALLGRPIHNATQAAALTPRQRQVLSLVAEGQANRQIAETLSITEQTVKNTLARAMERLGAPNRTAAAMAARDSGLL